ncbi:hypothetical protein Acor_08170 [Acrocarpospora corrugata]|uniref:Uncharacterized protein n=1 Tax=Acrocarpospora corrugata TaxID=35763 RepID=A0A5M3VPP2_9ACTN|nr:hypothetical protein [Acrocarpospora corrugata]GER98754.1 hypothetical protein Acor_08170 [Acrocarpospora corrugata]
MDVIHPQRVAWDTARVIVAASTADVYWWLSDMVGTYLGVMYQLKLAETRLHMLTEDALNAESGTWRVRLQDAMAERPELVRVLIDLTREISARMP